MPGTCSAATLSRPNLREVILIVLTAFVMLSLVPLTGWANQISLAQITLVGCGAFAMVEWGLATRSACLSPPRSPCRSA